MYTTKEQFDAATMMAIQKTRAQMASSDLYDHLVSLYRHYGVEDLKFLADMPYDQGRTYVDKTFSDFMELHEYDPKTWPMQEPKAVIQTMRAYRKRQNQFKRTTPQPCTPTKPQIASIQCFGLNPEDWLVRKWTMAEAILQHRETGEIREIHILE